MREHAEKSRSQLKRESLALQKLGEDLAALPEKEIRELAVSPGLKEAVLAAKRMKRSSFRRQIRFIGGLLRQGEADTVRQALAKQEELNRQRAGLFRQAESWRDRLLEEDDAALDEIISMNAGTDTGRLRQLARNARKEAQQGKPPRSSRELFRYVQELLEESALAFGEEE